jgi:hypothetical protein
MATSYTGLYKVGPDQNSRPTDIQVTDPFGNELPLPIDRYISRDVKPDWQDLSWQDDAIRRE